MDQRRSLLDTDEQERDRFLDFVDDLVEFATARAVPLIFAGVAATLAMIIAVWFVNQRANSNVDEFVALYAAASKVDELLASGVSEDSEAELTEALLKLSAVDEGPRAARARFIEARGAMLREDNTRAAALFQRATNSANGVVGLFSQLGYAAALERSGDTAGALQAYDESRLASFKDVPGYDVAWTEAMFGKARVARLEGRPTVAQTAYEAVIEAFKRNRDEAIHKRERQLTAKAQAWLNQDATAAALPSDIRALYRLVDERALETLQQSASQELQEGLRLQKEMEEHLDALAEAKRREAEGNESTALYRYGVAAGGFRFAPTQQQYQRARLELDRLDQMRPR